MLVDVHYCMELKFGNENKKIEYTWMNPKIIITLISISSIIIVEMQVTLTCKKKEYLEEMLMLRLIFGAIRKR